MLNMDVPSDNPLILGVLFRYKDFLICFTYINTYNLTQYHVNKRVKMLILAAQRKHALTKSFEKLNIESVVVKALIYFSLSSQ